MRYLTPASSTFYPFLWHTRGNSDSLSPLRPGGLMIEHIMEGMACHIHNYISSVMGVGIPFKLTPSNIFNF